MFSKSIGGKEISQHQKSRIYHTAANFINKNDKFDKKKVNKFDVTCRTMATFFTLSESQIN